MICVSFPVTQDPIVGLKEGVAERLDKEDAQWRVNGKRGVVHFVNRNSRV